jgi:hypothetical protein
MSEYRFLCPQCGRAFEEGTQLTVCPDCQVPVRSTGSAAVGVWPPAPGRLPPELDVAGVLQAVLDEQPQEDTFDAVLHQVVERDYPEFADAVAPMVTEIVSSQQRSSGVSRLEAARGVAEGRLDWRSLPLIKIGPNSSATALAHPPPHIDLASLMCSVLDEQPQEEEVDSVLREVLRRNHPESAEFLFPLVSSLLDFEQRDGTRSRLEAARCLAEGKSEIDVSTDKTWTFGKPGSKLSAKIVLTEHKTFQPARPRSWLRMLPILIIVAGLLAVRLVMYLLHGK